MQGATKRGMRRIAAVVVGIGAAGVAIGWRFGDRPRRTWIGAHRRLGLGG